VARVRYGVYLVPSTSSAEVYTVQHEPGQDETLFCSCPGRFHPACAHRAAVYAAKLEARGLRVKAPTKTAVRKEQAA
jgi:uncharacterized Zn finger protein